jgi:hypothetical protein
MRITDAILLLQIPVYCFCSTYGWCSLDLPQCEKAAVYLFQHSYIKWHITRDDGKNVLLFPVDWLHGLQIFFVVERTQVFININIDQVLIISMDIFQDVWHWVRALTKAIIMACTNVQQKQLLHWLSEIKNFLHLSKMNTLFPLHTCAFSSLYFVSSTFQHYLFLT